MTPSRILAVFHVLAGILLLPLSMVFGIGLVPFLALGPLWIVFLGIRLWRSGAKVYTLVRRTHFVGIGIALVLVAHGILALRAASRSATEGGGLLGAYGLIPIAYGVLLGVLSIVSLVMARPGNPSE